MKNKIVVSIIFLTSIIFYSCESNDSPVINNTPLSTVPQLLSPENNSTISTLEPVYDWTDFPNSTSYSLQISLNSAFTTLLVDTTGLTSSQYSTSGTILNDSNSYYWRVKAIRPSDTTDWSSTFSFATSIQSVNPTNKVLIELFTNTSCLPCVEANIYLDDIYELHGVTSNDANVVLLRIHTAMFAGDPFYLYNVPDNIARINYYPNAAIANPRSILLGTFMGNYSAAPWTNKINEKLSSTRPLGTSLTNTYNTSTRSGTVNVKISQGSGSSYTGLVYHIAVAENDIQYNAPNGETHFSNTMRDLITPPAGQTFDIGSGQTNSYSHDYSIASEINQNLTDLIVFVQVVATREVLAVEKIKIQ